MGNLQKIYKCLINLKMLLNNTSNQINGSTKIKESTSYLRTMTIINYPQDVGKQGLNLLQDNFKLEKN